MRQAIMFYLVFSLVYALMHLVVFVQASRALDLAGWPMLLCLVWLTAMTLAPAALGAAGERTGPAAQVAFLWMGFVFYLFLFSFILLVTRAAAWPEVHRALFVGAVGASLAIAVFGWFNARDIRVRQLEINVPNLPEGVDKVRLAVISDVHLYSVEGLERLGRILPILEGLDYDVLVSLGDLVESGIHRHHWREAAARLDRLRPKFGKFAVGGNHELYADIMAHEDVSREFHEAAGFAWLDGQAVDIGGMIWLAGVDYPGHARHPGDAMILAKLGRDKPVVFLKHLPRVDPEATGKFDLQLSGHSHSGQLWPFYYLVRHYFRYMQGLYDLGSGSKLYVTPGTGTWGPPMRVGSDPEVTLVVLHRP